MSDERVNLGARAARALHGADAPETAERAVVQEVFLSFQGEGVLAGVRQVFLRLAGCDIRCPWCDTPEALSAKAPRAARIETAPGGAWRAVANPLAPAEAAREAIGLARAYGPVRWLAVTGGEPTIWTRFLAGLAPALAGSGLAVYLETNSLHPEALDALGSALGFVSADIKLPFTDYPDIPLERYRAFLSRVRGPGQVKLVITGTVPDDDVRAAARLARESAPHLPVILQPVTPTASYGAAASPEQILRQQAVALAEVEDARIIPQLHKALGVR